MKIHYCAVRLSSSNTKYFAFAKFLNLTFVLCNSNKRAFYLCTYWNHTFWQLHWTRIKDSNSWYYW